MKWPSPSKMLERLEIIGFQRHSKKLIVDLDPCITTLAGPTDKGKSAILRALRWLCLNRSPPNHINWDSQQATVRLYVDGHKIVRKQGEGINCYILDNEILKSFNRGVPEQISDILRVSHLNFQCQHEGHFWFSLTAPQISKELNQIVDLEIIDRSTANVTSELRRAKTEVEVIEERLQKAREQHKELKWIVKCHKDLKEIESKTRLIDGKRSHADGLEILLSAIHNHESTIQDVGKRIVLIEKIISIARKHTQLENRANRLEETIDKIEECSQLTIINIPDTSELEELVEKASILENIITKFQETKETLCQVQKQLATNSELLEKKLKGRCPLCGAKLSPSFAQTFTCHTDHQ